MVALLCAIALVYTTPWDNYLVYREVWAYGADRIIGTIGYVPVEEYLFFILQPILSGLWLLVVLDRLPPRVWPGDAQTIRRLGAFGGLLITAAGAVCLTSESTFYLGLILAWAGPVLAGQWYLAGERFATRAWSVGIAVPTVYLWIADRVAISDGIWSISTRYTVGWEPLGLPIEEAVFFLVTNALIVQGVLMFDPLRQRIVEVGNDESSRSGRREAGLRS